MNGHLSDEDIRALDPYGINPALHMEHLSRCKKCRDRMDDIKAGRSRSRGVSPLKGALPLPFPKEG